MEMIGLLLAIISTAATIWGLFARTDALLTDIRDVLIEIRDQRK
jgi:hypothetical protein